MECEHARLLLQVAHPLATELDRPETELLAGHLAICPACGSWAESERLADEKIGSVVRDVPVPPGLKKRILTKLYVQRDAWYRGWLVRAAGVAAVLLLAAGTTYAVWWNKRPVPDWTQVVSDINEVAYTPELVQEAFAGRGVRMTAPTQFDYVHLESWGMKEFQGRQVPVLLFFFRGKGGLRAAVAQVYVLNDRQFNLDAARTQLPPQGSRQNIQLLRHPNNPQVLYVVIWSADVPIEVFFRPTKPQA